MADTTSGSDEGQTQDVAALSIALQHPLLGADQQVLCRLLQACKAWRAAVQQAAAGSAKVCLQVDLSDGTGESIGRLGSFALWLRKHGSLMSTLSITRTDPLHPMQVTENEHFNSYTSAADLVLPGSLQVATAAAAAAAAPEGAAAAVAAVAAAGGSMPAAAAAVPGGMTSNKPLGLRSYSSNVLYSPAILSALPASSLTQLELTLKRLSDRYTGSVTANQAVGAALASLTSLQQLRIDPHNRNLSGEWVAGCSQLTQLTQLELKHVDPRGGDSNLQQLPASLEVLNMNIVSGDIPAEVELGHLTRLQQLELLGVEHLGPIAFIPDSALQQLPASLQRLKLHYISQATGPTILSHLVELQQLQLVVVPPPKEGSVLPSQLTSLEVDVSNGMGQSPTPAAALLNFTALQQLHQLTIRQSADTPEQLQRLAGLPQLQRLALQYSSDQKATAAAPAWKLLSQLCSLEIAVQKMQLAQLHPLLLSAGKATSLTKLCLRVENIDRFPMGEEGEGLCEQLVGLKQLRELTLSVPEECFVARDGLHLSALTALTKLDLSSWHAAAYARTAYDVREGKRAAAQLQWLGLECAQSGAAAQPAVGMLTGLQQLVLNQVPAGVPQHLAVALSQLAGLQVL